MSSSSLKERDAICLFVKSLLVKELAKASPDFVPLSICLGLIEASLTKKDEQRWPTDIEVTSVGCEVVHAIVATTDKESASCRSQLIAMW